MAHLLPVPAGRSLARRLLPATFALVIAAFTAATIYSQQQTRQISEDALLISRGLAPAIERLAGARGELRSLDRLLEILARAGRAEEPEVRRKVRETLDRLRSEIEAYLLLGGLPGASGAAPQLLEDLERLEQAVGQVPAGAEPGPLPESYRRAYADAARTIIAAIGAEARLARDAAVSIEETRRRATRRAFGLDFLGIVLSAAAAWLTIRALRRYDEAREESGRQTRRRAEELEMFAGRVAHDLLNPLGGVALSVDLARRAPDVDRARAAAERARSSVARAHEIIRDLLSFARAGARSEPDDRSDVAEVLRDVVADLRPAAEEQRIEVRVGPVPACAVACKPGLLTSLVSNLLRNAIRYMGDAPVRRVDLRVVDTGRAVRVEVSDTGPGLDLAAQQAVFEPYVRAGQRGGAGLGLGLATVKRICESHGGQFGVRSVPGQGSLFWFELPGAR
jgi:signal transduction histidine kinase